MVGAGGADPEVQVRLRRGPAARRAHAAERRAQRHVLAHRDLDRLEVEVGGVERIVVGSYRHGAPG